MRSVRVAAGTAPRRRAVVRAEAAATTPCREIYAARGVGALPKRRRRDV